MRTYCTQPFQTIYRELTPEGREKYYRQQRLKQYDERLAELYKDGYSLEIDHPADEEWMDRLKRNRRELAEKMVESGELDKKYLTVVRA